MKDVLFYCIPLVVALGLVAIRDTDYFILLLVLPTVVWPQTLATPAGTQMALSDLLMVIAVGAWIVSNSVRAAPDPFTRGNSMLLPAIVFVAVNFFSVLWSDHPRSTLTFVIQLISITILSPVVFASLPRSVAVIRRGLFMYIFVTFGLAIATCVVFLVNVGHGNAEGTYLPGIHKNALGSFLAGGMVLAYAFSISKDRIGPRRLMIVAAIVEMLGMFASVSRGSIIGGLVSIIVMSLVLGRQRLLTLVVVAVAAAVYLSVVGASPATKKTDTEGAYDSSIVRKYSFNDAITKIKAEPFLGSGASTYSAYIPQLHIGVADPNNMFLLTWAELGIAGILALAWLLVRYGQLFWRARRLPGESATMGVACGAVALSLFVHFQVDITWTRGTSTLAFTMIGIMLALTRLAHVRAAPTLERLEDRQLVAA